MFNNSKYWFASFKIITLIFSMSLLMNACGKLKDDTEIEHVQRAKELQSKNDIAAAIIELKNALQKNSKNAEARLLLGEMYLKQGLGKEAEKELRMAASLGVNEASLKIALGSALLQQQEYRRLLQDIQVSDDMSKLNIAKVLVMRGDAQIALNHAGEGCKLITQALEVYSSYVPGYHSSAKCELLKRRPDMAHKELETALKLDNKNARTWTLLGDLERISGHFREAKIDYDNALNISSTDLDALISRATLELQTNELTKAGQDINSALKLSKDHPLVTHLYGVLLYRQYKYADAKIAFENSLKNNPNYLPSQLWLGLTVLAQGNYEQALSHLAQFNRRVPNSLPFIALQAQIQAKLGDKEAAKETLKSQRNVKVDDPQNLALLGQAYMMTDQNELGVQYLSQMTENPSTTINNRLLLATALTSKGDQAGAIKELEKIIQLAPTNDKAYELMIEILIKQKEYDRVLGSAKALQELKPKDGLPLNYQGVALLLKGNYSEAKTAFEKALETQPGYFPAADNLAKLALHKGELDVARKYYQSVLNQDKNSLPALMGLYTVAVKAKQLKEATKILETAIAGNPDAPQPATILAQNYLTAGNPIKALEVLEKVSRANPDDPGLLEARGLAYLHTGDTGNALGAYNRLVQLFPQSADAKFYMATVHGALGDAAATRLDLIDALKLNPRHVKAKKALAQLDNLQGRHQESIRLAREIQKDLPNSPDGFVVEAEALGAQRNFRSAIQLIIEAQKKFPDADELVFELVRLKLAAQDDASAIAVIKAWRNAHPKDSRGPQLLAETYRQLGKEKEAIDAYNDVLKLSPNSPAVINNLSWLLRKSDPKRALILAENLNKTNPNVAAFLDTWGSILIQQGSITKGTEILTRASQISPESPEIKYHLASALAKSGDKALARKELERLLNSGKKFSESDDAHKLYREL